MPTSDPIVTPPHGKKSGVSARFYPLFLDFNRRLVAILRHLRPPLSTSESHILAAIDDAPGITARELVTRLQLEKSTISRALREFIDRSFLSEETALDDRRRKQLAITPSGRRVLRDDSRSRNRELELAVDPLNSSEQRDLRGFLEQMAGNLGEPPVDRHPEDHPIKREVRRLTRAMGFIGRSCLGTGHPVEECQVVHRVYSLQGSAPMADLVRRLPYDPSAISRLVSRLEERALIEKTHSESDHRSRVVRLSESGYILAESAIEHGEAFLRSALRGFTPRELDRFESILRGFVLEEFTPTTTTEGAVEVRRVLGRQDRFAARAFLVERLVESGLHRRLPESLLSDDAAVMWARIAGELVGVSEVALEGEDAKIVHLAWRAPENREREVIAALLEHPLTRLKAASITLSGETIDPFIIGRLFPELRRRSPLRLTPADLPWLHLPRLTLLADT